MMNRILVVMLAALPGLFPAADAHAADPVPVSGAQHLIVGYSSNVFIDVDIEEARSVTKVWSDMILKRRFPEGASESLIFMDTESIEEALVERKVDLLVLASNDYLFLKDRVPLQPVFVTANDNGFYHQVVLLVRRDAGIRQLGDLRQRQLTVSKDQSRTIHMIWLETLLMKEGSLDPKEFFSSVKEVRRSSQAILPVFFRQTDACVTTRQAFDLACEMNPQVGKELTVLAQSPEIIGGVIAFRAGYGERLKEIHKEVLSTLDADPQGRQLLKLFRMRRLVPFRPEYMKTMEALFREHRDLQSRYAKRK
jgi:phosphonate transport system substrate-binding protein